MDVIYRKPTCLSITKTDCYPCIMLNLTQYGTPTSLPNLLIAHGLFGSGRNWGAIANRLSTDRQVTVVDMRNHAGSFHAPTMTYADMADDLAKVIDAPCDVLGHSMGGKASMILSMKNKGLIDHLIVADIAPVSYTHSQNHLIDAMEATDLSTITKRSDADALLSSTIPEREIRAFLLQSLDVEARKWRFNLETLRAYMPDIIGFPEIDGTFSGETLFLSGASSDYVQPAYRDRIKTLFPKARFAKIPGAGHWLHAEKPREFDAAIRTFLTR